MNHFIVTSGCYSDYSIHGVFETQLNAIKFIEKTSIYDVPIIELWCDDKHIAEWKYCKGGFVDGTLELSWDERNE